MVTRCDAKTSCRSRWSCSTGEVLGADGRVQGGMVSGVRRVRERRGCKKPLRDARGKRAPRAQLHADRSGTPGTDSGRAQHGDSVSRLQLTTINELKGEAQ